MDIRVGYYSFFRRASGKSSEIIGIADGTTLKELVSLLVERYGEQFRKYAVGSDGEISPMLKVSWNGKLVQKVIPGWVLREGDDVKIFPPIGGG